ncbi:hypothetical protein CC2G_008419 [Coprinopsis cinerea AmutBmut pab1-1]|nr:hypothetical protein CC2G_008419 [Coprinopsis cinerea AmutBmut pab1-1]
MVLQILEAVATSKYFPTTYLVHIVVGFIILLAVRTLSQGRKTTWERNLHARTVLVTGGFTPLGLITS